jgi:4,4'-diaponeurosporenoate glycosyltransferase
MLIVTVIAGASLLLGALGFVFFARTPLVPGRGAGGPLRSVTVIVPARDEEGNLPTLLASLAAQTVRPLEIIVADDGSTDGTAAVAAAAGARVLPVGPKPPGWRGKTWPCFQAAEAARGEALLFLDADVRLDAPDALERLLAALPEGGLLSVEPFHAVARPYEQLSAVFNVVRAASVGAFGLRGGRPRGAFGPCLLVARPTYFATGGHSHPLVRGEILENFALGKVLLDAARPVSCYAGRGAVSCRMYPGGLGELVEGWSKAFVTGAAGTPPGYLLLAVGWISGAVASALLLSAAPLLAGVPGLAVGGAVYLAFAAQMRFMLTRLGSYWPLTALLFPVAVVAFLVIFARSAFLVHVRGRVTWRGQQLEVAARPRAE